VARVFALYAALAVGQLDGTELLADASGSLRALQHPGLAPDWSDPKVFADVVARIARSPSGRPAASHVHMH